MYDVNITRHKTERVQSIQLATEKLLSNLHYTRINTRIY